MVAIASDSMMVGVEWIFTSTEHLGHQVRHVLSLMVIDFMLFAAEFRLLRPL
jgi:hypothetical protein